jgi:hypothetical protein
MFIFLVILSSKRGTVKQFLKYYRVSTCSQADSGLVLSAQQRDIDLYLSTYAEKPWEVIAEFKNVQSG